MAKRRLVVEQDFGKRYCCGGMLRHLCYCHLSGSKAQLLTWDGTGYKRTPQCLEAERKAGTG